MKMQDYKIGNIYMGNRPFVLTLDLFNLVSSHYFATNECRYDAVSIDKDRLKDLKFIEKNKGEYSINFDNRFIFTLEYDNDNYWHLWLNGKHLLCVMYIHELQDIIRMFSKCELELK